MYQAKKIHNAVGNQKGQAITESIYVLGFISTATALCFCVLGLYWNFFWSHQVMYRGLLCAEAHTNTPLQCTLQVRNKLKQFLLFQRNINVFITTHEDFIEGKLTWAFNSKIIPTYYSRVFKIKKEDIYSKKVL